MASIGRGSKQRKGTTVVLCVIMVACLLQPCTSKPSIIDDFIGDGDDEGEQTTAADEPFEAALKELFEDNMIVDDRLQTASYGDEAKRTIAKKTPTWPGGVVPYEIDPLFPKIQQDLLRRVHKLFHDRTCIRFKIRDPLVDDNYVYYTNIDNVCSSNIGMIGGKQVIHLGKDCGVVGTYLHESMHALGMIHEHSRPDRDNYQDRRIENIKPEDLSNSEKFLVDQIDGYQGHNFASTTAYRKSDFLTNRRDTLQPLKIPGLVFGQRLKFSCGDLYAINQLYNCREQLDQTDNICRQLTTPREE